MSYREDLQQDVGAVAEHTGSLMGILARGEPDNQMRAAYCDLLRSFLDRWEGQRCPITGDLVDEIVEVNGIHMGQPLALAFLGKNPEAIQRVEAFKAAQSDRAPAETPQSPALSVVGQDEDQGAKEAAETAEAEAKQEQRELMGEDPEALGLFDGSGQPWGTLGPDADQVAEPEREAGDKAAADLAALEGHSDPNVDEAVKMAGQVRGRVLEGHGRADVTPDTLSDQIQALTGWSAEDTMAFLALFVRAQKEYEANAGDQIWLAREINKIKDSRYRRPGDLSDNDVRILWLSEHIAGSLQALQDGEATLDLADVNAEGILDRMSTNWDATAGKNGREYPHRPSRRRHGADTDRRGSTSSRTIDEIQARAVPGRGSYWGVSNSLFRPLLPMGEASSVGWALQQRRPLPVSLYHTERTTMSALLLILFVLASCSKEAPVAPLVVVEPEEPSWCGPGAQGLIGTWVGQFEVRGHQYESTIVFVENGECSFAYSYDTFILDHEDQDRLRIYDSQGVIVVTKTEVAGDLLLLDVEAKQTYVRTLEPDGTETEISRVRIYDTSKAKLWGTTLHLWQRDYGRVEP